MTFLTRITSRQIRRRLWEGVPRPASVTEDDLTLPHAGHQFPSDDPTGLVPCDVLPIWHVPGRCPTSFLCTASEEA